MDQNTQIPLASVVKPSFFYRIVFDLLLPRQVWYGGWLVTLMCIAMVFETASVGAVIPAMSVLMNPESKSLPQWLPAWATAVAPASQEWIVLAALLAILGIFIAKTIVLLVLTWCQTRFVADLNGSISERLFRAYLQAPWTFHLERNSAVLISTVIQEANVFACGCSSLLVVFAEILVCVGIGGVLIAIEPVGALTVIVAFIGATVLFQRLTGLRMKAWSDRRVVHDQERLKHSQQGLGAMKDVKIASQEGYFVGQFSQSSRDWNAIWQRQLFLTQIPRLWYELVAVFAVVILALTMVVQHEPVASIIPRIGLFAAAAFRLLPSATRLLSSMQTIRYATPAARMIRKDLACESAVGAAETIKDFKPLDADIALDKVSYRYAGADQPSLQDIDLKIEKGTTVGIIGESGAGKSTLTDLVLGLLDVQAGTISIGEAKIQDVCRAWQRSIGYVPQSIHLIDDTIAKNIAFGLAESDIDTEAIRCAAKAAQLSEFLSSLPLGLDTVVGERGVRLSGGQRQRIGIARALYRSPTVLVLDEATSALDVDTERSLMEAINALHGQKTIIIIAHRYSTVACCDVLYRLAGGRCVASGVPSEILPAGLNGSV